ncbi:hypothetical protein [Microvirga tunisiensis]|uniref:hypothetical protein n=1 Tax=Microvirga tunisiensis TaxID=2108360 RepID=UPI001386A5E7|nr:hypothetical protein [Microvirga tunisiensis]
MLLGLVAAVTFLGLSVAVIVLGPTSLSVPLALLVLVTLKGLLNVLILTAFKIVMSVLIVVVCKALQSIKVVVTIENTVFLMLLGTLGTVVTMLRVVSIKIIVGVTKRKSIFYFEWQDSTSCYTQSGMCPHRAGLNAPAVATKRQPEPPDFTKDQRFWRQKRPGKTLSRYGCNRPKRLISPPSAKRMA